MVNVVLVVNGMYAGGGGRVITWLATCLADAGHRVVLVVQAPSSTDFFRVDPRVRVVRAGLSPRRAARLIPVRDVLLGIGVRRVARQHRADVVVSFIRQVNLAVIAGLLGSGTPVVVSERSHPFAYPDLGPVRRRLRPGLYRRAARVVVLSNEIADLARSRWRLRAVTMIANPAPPAPQSMAPMAERDHTVLSVGRLHELKGHLDLVEAWALSSARSRGWRLRIVGGGPMRAPLDAAIRRLAIDDSVALVGESDLVAAEYRRASVFVLPSLVEGFPNALLEAMSAGCACIATDCPGTARQILGDGVFGLLVPVGRPGEMAVALDHLTDDLAQRARFGEAATQGIKNLGPDDVFATWLGELEGVVGERRHRGTPRQGDAIVE